MKSDATPFQRGYEAYCRGFDGLRSEYPFGSEEDSEWFRGWAEAERDCLEQQDAAIINN